jgi:hypothetical protein
LVTRDAARLSEGDKGEQERADALEACLSQAEQARRAGEVAEGLRLRLERLALALQEAEQLGCKCDAPVGVVCRMHAIPETVVIRDQFYKPSAWARQRGPRGQGPA